MQLSLEDTRTKFGALASIGSTTRVLQIIRVLSCSSASFTDHLRSVVAKPLRRVTTSFRKKVYSPRACVLKTRVKYGTLT